MDSHPYQAPQGPNELVGAHMLGGRPRSVSIAVCLMWAEWALRVVNLLHLYFAELVPEHYVVSGLVASAVMAFIIRAVSQGKRWARIAYVLVVAIFFFLPLLSTPSLWFEMSDGERTLTAGRGVAYLAIFWLLFWPGTGRWFRGAGPVRQLFRPSPPVKLLVYNFWLVGVFTGLSALGSLRGWEPPVNPVLLQELQLLQALSGFLGLFAARWLHRRQQDRIQSERNSRASETDELASAFRDGQRAKSVPPYVLYLRPFATAGRLPFPFAAEDRSFADNYLYGSKFDLESWLGKVAREGLPAWNVYAIGDLGGGVGADKIRARDEDWMGLFTLLAARAQALLVCPLDRPGIRWEIDEMLTSPDLLRKTVFVLPPPRRFGGGDIIAAWEQTRIRLVDRVAAFPAFGSGCMLFALRPGDLAVLELHRGPVALKRFKALVLGLRNSGDIEALWHDAPAEIQAQLPQILRELASASESVTPPDRPIFTMPVSLRADIAVAERIKVLKELPALRKRPGMYIGDLTFGSETPALQWLIERSLILVERAATISEPSVLRLHPAALTWVRAQTWCSSMWTDLESPTAHQCD